jgi:lycopene cyclase domain-containing protein
MELEYLLLLGLVIFIPFVKSFSKEIGFYRNPRRLFFSVGFPFIIFIVWDVYAVSRGHWTFNNDYIIGLKILGLPIEEVLFFTVIPFCALFTWESVKYFMRKG